MLAVKGYYDGNCVRLLEPLNIKKNQNIIIHIDEKLLDDKPRKCNDAFLRAMEDDKFVIHTGLNVEEYMKELRENDRF